MSDHPLVSVIIPAYNTAGYIERCLQSVTEQTLRDIEIIVVDDGSTDDTAARVEAHADPRLTLSRKPNGGPSSAKNLGLDRARGEFVLLLDSDDWIEASYLEDMSSAALAGELDIVA
ncbi:MAG TPA: glycosyltransferase family A protein, partial [Burkholderiaceae bacterium]|nr:glycosyltransferase family A protein [Burkholderiaceae bacterium]